MGVKKTEAHVKKDETIILTYVLYTLLYMELP